MERCLLLLRQFLLALLFLEFLRTELLLLVQPVKRAGDRLLHHGDHGSVIRYQLILNTDQRWLSQLRETGDHIALTLDERSETCLI